MIFKLNLDYSRDAKDNDKLSDAEVTLTYLTYAVRISYKDGLDNQFRRMWARIQRKLDAAIDDNKNEIDLDVSEFDFIKGAFKSPKIPSDIAKYFVILEDYIDELSN